MGVAFSRRQFFFLFIGVLFLFSCAREIDYKAHVEHIESLASGPDSVSREWRVEHPGVIVADLEIIRLSSRLKSLLDMQAGRQGVLVLSLKGQIRNKFKTIRFYYYDHQTAFAECTLLKPSNGESVKVLYMHRGERYYAFKENWTEPVQISYDPCFDIPYSLFYEGIRIFR